MRSALIIVYPPSFDNIPGIFQANEPVFIKTLISQPADEALGKSVLYRLPRSDEVQLNAIAIGPLIKATTGEFRPVVHGNCARQPSYLSQTIQNGDDPRT